jgi:SAM-dependent methyltransferase
MEYKGVEICCPHPDCRADLRWVGAEQNHLRCDADTHTYPVVCGIPDLRVFPDPYIGPEEDRAKGERVAEQAKRLRFDELIDFYYSVTTVVPPEHARLYKRGLLAGEAKARSALEAWESALETSGAAPPGRRLLELGCGTGPLLVASATRYAPTVGVDIAFRWLVMGQKRLAEAGIDPPLICACAEALPFPEGQFDVVVADSVVELVDDQDACLAEARRALGDGGVLFLATPNRFSLGPDPHTGLLAGGFLPDSLTAAYMRWKNAKPPHRNLLTARALERLLHRNGFTMRHVFLPDFPAEQRVYFGRAINMGISAYQVVKRMPVGRQLMRTFGPRLQAVARC